MHCLTNNILILTLHHLKNVSLKEPKQEGEKKRRGGDGEVEGESEGLGKIKIQGG